MILRLASGSVTPLRSLRNLSPALTATTLRPICLYRPTTSSYSFLRSNPVSTNIHVKRSPIAKLRSCAATDESTPPDRPSITRSSPNCSRREATVLSMKEAGVQSPLHPQMFLTKLDNMRLPSTEWYTSGWNCMPHVGSPSIWKAATGMLSVLAIMR